MKFPRRPTIWPFGTPKQWKINLWTSHNIAFEESGEAMIREVPHQGCSICVKERDTDVKEIKSIGIIGRNLIELRSPVDSRKQRRIRKGKPIVPQSPSKQPRHDRSQLERQGSTRCQSRFKSKIHPGRESIYVARPANYCIGSAFNHSTHSNAAGHKDNQSSSHLAAASLSIRSLPHEIEIQETEERSNCSAKSIDKRKALCAKPSHQCLLSQPPNTVP